MSKQEDAKEFYAPLQIIARKYACAVLALTHLSASGGFLGRRVLEKVRVAIRMEWPGKSSDDPKRRVEVIKSNSRSPAALGMTMNDACMDFDENPPERAEAGTNGPAKSGRPPEQIQAAISWLSEQLASGPKRVSYTRNQGEMVGHSARTLYRAVQELKINTFEAEGKQWWQLTKT